MRDVIPQACAWRNAQMADEIDAATIEVLERAPADWAATKAALKGLKRMRQRWARLQHMPGRRQSRPWSRRKAPP